MQANGAIYESKTHCPICEKEFAIVKVKAKSTRIIKQDTDFCPYYEGVNPLFYESIVCSHCGFGVHVSNFSAEINKYAKEKNRKSVQSSWTPRDMSGERDTDQALNAFKLVLFNLVVREELRSEQAKICMRIAWLYRYKNDNENERKYLKHALEHYTYAYQKEDLTKSGVDEFICLFMIAELSRRLDMNEESLRWFSRLIASYSDPAKRSRIPKRIIDTTQDLVTEIRKKIQLSERTEEAAADADQGKSTK